MAEGKETRAVTKRTLRQEVAERFPQYTKRQVEAVVDSVFQSLTDSLVHGERVELRGFGSFQTTYRPARKGRNPRTGAVVSIPAKRVPVFKVGKELRARVNDNGTGA